MLLALSWIWTPSTATAADADIVSLVPARLLETRRGPGEVTVDGRSQGEGRRAAGSVYELPVAGRGGVPAGAGAVMLNVTAVAPDAPGFLTVFPCGSTVPTASNVNYGPGDVVPNMVFAKVGTGGKVCVFTLAATDIVADVSGYVTGDGGLGGETAGTARFISGDINGDRHAASWDNMRPLVRYSVSDESIAFVMRNGEPDDPDYVPIAAGENCGDGFCVDLYVRDLDTGATTPIVGQLGVTNPPKFSRVEVGGPTNWAVSADHTIFVFTWSCYSVSGDTSIGGTPVCRNGAELEVLVRLDTTTGHADVIATGRHPKVDDISADGSVVLFENASSDPATSFEPCWLPQPCASDPLWIWDGPGSARKVGHLYAISDDDRDVWSYPLSGVVLSGDGSRFALIMSRLYFTGTDDFLGTDEVHLLVFDRSTSSVTRRQLTAPAGEYNQWYIAGFDGDGDRVAVSRKRRVFESDGTTTYLGGVVDVYAAPGLSLERSLGEDCAWSGFPSMSADGRYIACSRSNRGFKTGRNMSPTRVDVTTGASTPFATLETGFDPDLHRSPIISQTGSTAALLAHRSPEDDPFDGVAGPYAQQLYVADLP